MGYQVVNDPIKKLKMLQQASSFVVVPLFLEDYILNKIKIGKTSKQVKRYAEKYATRNVGDEERQILEWINNNPKDFDTAYNKGFRVELSQKENDELFQKFKDEGYI